MAKVYCRKRSLAAGLWALDMAESVSHWDFARCLDRSKISIPLRIGSFAAAVIDRILFGALG